MEIKLYIPQLIASILAILLLVFSKYLTRKLIRKYAEILHKSEQRMLQIKQIISILLNVIFVFLIAVIWGVQPHNLLIGLSSVFAVIGVALFAQWSVLSNITAGILMFFTAPFRVGDRIRLVDKDLPIDAVIENIQAFYTHIRTEENELIVLPNNLFLQKIVLIKTESDLK